jgi:uncharacterized LabA/DUF88 family protein
MKFYEQERVAMFIDGANLYATARALGFDIDYKRLLEVFSGRCNLVRALYYTALVEDQEYSPIRPLVDWLDYNGYTMVTKPTKEFTDATGRRKVKGNMDIELAVDVMEMLDHLDHIVLFSGDGDFRRLVEAIQRRGRRVTVVSTVRRISSLTWRTCSPSSPGSFRPTVPAAASACVRTASTTTTMSMTTITTRMRPSSRRL